MTREFAPADYPPAVRTRWLVMAVFFLQPIAFGAWLPRIPDIQQRLELGPADLAMALLGLPIGTLTALLFAGRLVAHIGSRNTIIYGFVAFLGIVGLPALSQNFAWLFVTLAMTGAALSVLELGLNVAADEVEKAGGKFIMNTCHGFWSLGIMTGSLVGAGLAGAGFAPQWSTIGTAVAVLPLALAAAVRLPDLRRSEPGQSAPESWSLPGATLLGICLFVFGITMTEGAIADWSAVYLREAFAVGPGYSGLGYAVFAAMVAAGRFRGDSLKARFGARTLASACGALALAGIALVTAAPSAAIVFAGFALVGFGVSVGFPLAVSAAASLTDRPTAASVAILSFMALTGFLVGPPLIGFVAEAFDLRLGLAALLPVLALSLIMTRVLGR